MKKVRIRKIQKKDLLRCLCFYLELYDELLSSMKPDERKKKLEREVGNLEKAIEQSRGFVGELGGNALGYLIFELKERAVFISELYVNKHFRNRGEVPFGLGRKLVREAARTANNYSYPVVLKLPEKETEQYEQAKKFYLALGFEFIAGGKYECDRMILKGGSLRKLVLGE